MHRAFRRPASIARTGVAVAVLAFGAHHSFAEDDLAARGCEADCKIDNATTPPPTPDEPSAALDLIDGDGPPIGAYATRVLGTAINTPPRGPDDDTADAADIADAVIRATAPPPNAEPAGPPDPGDLGAVLASTDFATVSSGQIADGSITSARIERTAPEFRIRSEPVPFATALLVDEVTPADPAPAVATVTIELDGPGKELASAMADGEPIPRKPLADPQVSALDLALDDDPMARINGRLVQGLDRGPREADALNESVQSLLRDTASAPHPEGEAVQPAGGLDASIEAALSPDSLSKR